MHEKDEEFYEDLLEAELQFIVDKTLLEQLALLAKTLVEDSSACSVKRFAEVMSLVSQVLG